MNEPIAQRQPGTYEFIALAAFLIALVALTIDAMLPALPDMARDLKLSDPNSIQLVVGVFFGGMAAGQLLAGPLADSYGRRPVIAVGILLYFIGCLLCIYSWSFDSMLVGRLLQGLGASGPRVATMAIVRDKFEGRMMARIMSFIMGVFIVVPVVAPALGELVLWVADWRWIFGIFLFIATLVLIWFGVRQGETLAPAHKVRFSPANLVRGYWEVCKIPTSVGYIIAASLLRGAFIGYLSSAQQIFDVTYNRAAQFAFYFALLSIAIGLASMINGRIVMRFGMRLISIIALVGSLIVSVAVFIYSTLGLELTLVLFLIWACLCFFGYGLVMGNINALAMQPLGHIAGVGAAAVGFGSTFFSALIGIGVGQLFDGTATPLVLSFAVLSALTLGTVVLTERIAGNRLTD